MSLRDRAIADTARIIGDAEGSGQTTTLTSPSGVTHPVVGWTNDISQVVDPQTGMAVSGRTATVVYPFSSLSDAGFDEIPQGIESTGSKPWVVVFDDARGVPGTYKIASSDPDRTLGVVVCFLEVYRD